MKLGPDIFRNTPRFRTHFLQSDALLLAGSILFSKDDRYLAYLSDGGRLQLWDLPKMQEIPLQYEGEIWRGIFSDYLGGLLAFSGDRLLLFRQNSGFRCETVATNLVSDTPGLIDLNVDPAHVVLLTGRRVRWFDPASFSLQGQADLPEFSTGYIRQARIRPHEQGPRIRLVHISRMKPGTLQLNLLAYALNGELVDGAPFELPAGREIRSDNEFLAVAPLDDNRGFVLIDNQHLPAKQGIIDWPHAGIFRHHPMTGMIYPSDDAAVFAGVSNRCVAFWKALQFLASFEGDGTWYNVRPTNDGQRALFIYCMGWEGANLAGWFDIARGRPIGHCVGHISSLQHAFSCTNRYHATVFTDDMNGMSPDGIATGTIVLTDFESVENSPHSPLASLHY